MVDVPGTGRRFLLVFVQGQRSVAAFLGIDLGPVVDLERCELGRRRIKREQAITIDGGSPVLLVDPPVVKEEAFAIWIIDQLVPTLASKRAFGRRIGGLFG